MNNITVRKANRVIKVTENELARYIANGYVIIKDERQPLNKVVDNQTQKISENVVKEDIKPATTRKRKGTK